MSFTAVLPKIVGDVVPVFMSRRCFHRTVPLGKMKRSTSMLKIATKQVKMMQKLTQRSLERDKVFRTAPRPQQFGVASPRLPTSIHSNDMLEPRRIRTLQHIFLEHIAELLATDEFTEELGEHTVEIRSVRYDNAQNQLSIFWTPKGTEEEDRLVHQMLIRLAPKLRKQLSDQQLVGTIPKLEFLRDRTALLFRTLEASFGQVDYGPVDDDADEVGEVGCEVAVAASPILGIIKVRTEEKEVDVFRLNEVPEKRTDTGGIDRKALLEQLHSTPRVAFKKRERA
ncbi:hypothetical protein BV898_03860 [Hypsibius exemplaris]|uniref:Ribosome-binding factor A, mitochondrial n=1 Tax=Hypsibius exemplaris TaxID=2072580 RepID=A0A1W0X4S5_HYPEX|nr:hypothetical protein BV898_03860 [Hypsibius exemplaris]